MEIAKSIFSLAKSNNGFFKSEKQANLLIGQLNSVDGFIGTGCTFGNSVSFFAKYDEEGIVEITQRSNQGKGEKLFFKRIISGELNELQLKRIKQLERKVKAIEKKIAEKVSSFENGSYNGTGDISTYSEDMITRYNSVQNDLTEQVENINELIMEIKNN